MKRAFAVIACNFAFFGCSLLAGCAPATIGDVRDMAPDRKVSFNVSQGYERVYQKVIEKERDCWDIQGMRVHGDIYSEQRKAVITTRNPLGVFWVIDIQAINDSETRVTGTFAIGPAEKYGKALEGWVLHDSSECS